MWWHVSSIPSLRMQRQIDFCKLESSLVYLERVPSQSRLHNETLSQKSNNRKQSLLKYLGEPDYGSCHLHFWYWDRRFISLVDNTERPCLKNQRHCSEVTIFYSPFRHTSVCQRKCLKVWQDKNKMKFVSLKFNFLKMVPKNSVVVVGKKHENIAISLEFHVLY